MSLRQWQAKVSFLCRVEALFARHPSWERAVMCFSDTIG